MRQKSRGECHKAGREEAVQGVPAWPEPRRSCGYSPPGFFPAPPAQIFLPPRRVTRLHVSARTATKRFMYIHTHTCPLIVTHTHTHTQHIHTSHYTTEKFVQPLAHHHTVAFFAVSLNCFKNTKSLKETVGGKMNPLVCLFFCFFKPPSTAVNTLLEKLKAKPHLGVEDIKI